MLMIGKNIVGRSGTGQPMTLGGFVLNPMNDLEQWGQPIKKPSTPSCPLKISVVPPSLWMLLFGVIARTGTWGSSLTTRWGRRKRGEEKGGRGCSRDRNMPGVRVNLPRIVGGYCEGAKIALEQNSFLPVWGNNGARRGSSQSWLSGDCVRRQVWGSGCDP